jgi:hypothetical protein
MKSATTLITESFGGGRSGQATIRPGISRQLLDQFNHLATLPGRELEERPQETNGFDCFLRRSSQFLTQFHNGWQMFHLAPSIGNTKTRNSVRNDSRTEFWAFRRQFD